MWIQTQKRDEILEVNHIRMVSADDRTGIVNIIGKLERETVQLGSYQKKQAEEVMEDLKWEATYQREVYEMPKRDKEDEK